jgi:hypothetical protein
MKDRRMDARRRAAKSAEWDRQKRRATGQLRRGDSETVPPEDAEIIAVESSCAIDVVIALGVAGFKVWSMGPLHRHCGREDHTDRV